MRPATTAGRARPARRAATAGTARRRRTAIAAGASVLSAAAVAGAVLAAQPAGAAVSGPAAKTAHAAASASTCSPKTDYETTAMNGSRVWENLCGTGYKYGDFYFLKIRDASYPYHRVWLHHADINGNPDGAWCAWGPTDRTVPSEYRTTGSIQVSANTARC